MRTCCRAHMAIALEGLPAGFELKFNPTPEILVRDYLLPKLKGEPLPCKAAVKECNLYGDLHPEQIWEELGGPELCKGEDLFFFTPLKKKNKNFIRTNSVDGTWTGKHGKNVFPRNDNEEKKPIARWRRFVYKHSEIEHCGWTVFEYTVDVKDSGLKDLECSSYSSQVLCQLRKKDQNLNPGKRKRHDREASVNQDSHTDSGDPSDPDYNQLPQILDRNWDNLTQLQNSNTGHVVPRSPLNPTELPPTLEIDIERTWQDILRQLDLTPDDQDSQSHNLDQFQVQDSITDDVVPPSQLDSNSQHNWGTYPVPQSLSNIPGIPDIGATSSVLEVSREEYFCSNPSRIPDPNETEI